jgi:hypothetical protein
MTVQRGQTEELNRQDAKAELKDCLLGVLAVQILRLLPERH